MSKILIFSDIHVHQHKNSSKRLDDCLGALEWVFNVACERKIKEVLFLGDLFQDRQKIQVLSYQKTFDVLWKYHDKFVLWLLLGNHDLWYADKWDVSSVFPLRAIPNIRIIDSISTHKIGNLNIDFIPFTKDPISAASQFSNKSNIMCGHLAIDGAQLNTMYNTTSEVSVEFENDMVPVTTEFFDGWKKVFLGHYHGSQIINGFIEYVGSPLELNFSEAFQQKHCIVLDTETLEQEYVINNFSPKHLIVREGEIKKYNLTNNFVEILTEDISQTNLMSLTTEITSEHDVCELRFKEIRNNNDKIMDEVRDKFLNHTGDVLQRYVAAVGVDSLDETLLLDIAKDICSSD